MNTAVVMEWYDLHLMALQGLLNIWTLCCYFLSIFILRPTLCVRLFNFLSSSSFPSFSPVKRKFESALLSFCSHDSLTCCCRQSTYLNDKMKNVFHLAASVYESGCYLDTLLIVNVISACFSYFDLKWIFFFSYKSNKKQGLYSLMRTSYFNDGDDKVDLKWKLWVWLTLLHGIII